MWARRREDLQGEGVQVGGGSHKLMGHKAPGEGLWDPKATFMLVFFFKETLKKILRFYLFDRERERAYKQGEQRMEREKQTPR